MKILDDEGVNLLLCNTIIEPSLNHLSADSICGTIHEEMYNIPSGPISRSVGTPNPSPLQILDPNLAISESATNYLHRVTEEE
jgi:hypothetical protein